MGVGNVVFAAVAHVVDDQFVSRRDGSAKLTIAVCFLEEVLAIVQQRIAVKENVAGVVDHRELERRRQNRS